MRYKLYYLTIRIQHFIWRHLVFRSNTGPGGEKAGDRVILLKMEDDYTTLEKGLKGTVSFVDDFGTIHVNWDNGSTLGLLPDQDKWTVILRKK